MGYIINELVRMRMLMVGVYSGIAISSTYGFSIFTEHLKSKYGFTQSDITTISTVGNCAGYLSFLAGMLFDYAGPKVVLVVSGLLGFSGFVLFGLAFDDVVPNNHNTNSMMIQFSVFNAILYLGCPAIDLATLLPLMLNFPLDRGYMVIIQKTFSGLGTSALMAFFNGWFREESKEASNFSGYAYFLGSLILFFALIGAIFIDHPPYMMCQYQRARVSEEEKKERAETLKYFMRQRAPSRRLYIGCALVIVSLIFLMLESIITGYVATSLRGYLAISIIVVVVFIFFSAMAFPFQIFGRYRVVQRPHEKFPVLGWVDENSASDEPIANGPQEAEEACQLQKSAQLADPQYSGSFWQHLLSLDLWLLWITFLGIWGTGTVMQMNAAQVYRSIGHGADDPARLTLYVALISVGSAIGRLFAGSMDMYVLKRRSQGHTAILTPMFLPLAGVFLIVGYFLFALVPADALILPFLLAFIGNGMGWSLGSLTVRIIYAEDIGKHYSFLLSSGFVSTIALNRYMFGGMYDRKAREYGTTPACNHPDCVRRQMWILLAINIVSTIAAFVMQWRYKRFVLREMSLRRVDSTPELQLRLLLCGRDAGNSKSPASASLEEPKKKTEDSNLVTGSAIPNS